MAQDINKQTLIGNVGSDAELEALPNGTPVLRFRVASTKKYRSGEETKERTSWFTCKVFGKRATALAPNITKGTRLYIDGETVNNTVEKTVDGVSFKTTYTEILVDTLAFQGSRSGAAPSSSGDDFSDEEQAAE